MGFSGVLFSPCKENAEKQDFGLLEELCNFLLLVNKAGLMTKKVDIFWRVCLNVKCGCFDFCFISVFVKDDKFTELRLSNSGLSK